MIGSGEQVAGVDSTVVWQRLSEQLDAFIAAWETGLPPNLHEFVPAAPPCCGT